jgi:PleD family two-component response regulator
MSRKERWVRFNRRHHRELLEEILENAQATGKAAFSLSTIIIDIDTIHDTNIDPLLL